MKAELYDFVVIAATEIKIPAIKIFKASQHESPRELYFLAANNRQKSELSYVSS